MKYGILFGLQGTLCIFAGGYIGYTTHPAGWLLLWPALAFASVGAMYLLNRPSWLGKGADGQIHPALTTLLLPFFALTWGLWHVIRLTSSEDAYNQVTPTLWVGRRLLAGEIPEQIEAVIDLTSEFNEPLAITQSTHWHLVASLDAAAPSDDVFFHALRQVINAKQVVYIHCAQGHGRTALAAAIYLGMTQAAHTPEEAIATLQRHRPGIAPNTSQRLELKRLWALMNQHHTTTAMNDNA